MAMGEITPMEPRSLSSLPQTPMLWTVPFCHSRRDIDTCGKLQDDSSNWRIQNPQIQNPQAGFGEASFLGCPGREKSLGLPRARLEAECGAGGTKQTATKDSGCQPWVAGHGLLHL